MSESDVNVESLEVLQIAVSRFGVKALSDSSILEGICEDRLSDFPKESSLLVTAAKSDVATLLQQQANAVGINDAIKLAANSLTLKSSISPDASMWVVSQFARVLGYDITNQNFSNPGNAVVQTSPILDITQPPGQSSQGPVNNPTTIMETPTPQFPRNDQQYIATPQSYNYPNQAQPLGQPYPAPQVSPPFYGSTPPGMYPPQPVSGSPKSNKKSFAAIGTVLVIIIAYFVIAGVSHLPPFSKTNSITTTSTSTTLGNSGTRTPTTGSSSTKSYLSRLNSYIPTSLTQAGTCSQSSTIKSGAVVAVSCMVSSGSNLPISQVEYFIFSSSATLYSYYNYLLSKYGITQNQIPCGSFTSFAVNCEEIYSVSNRNRGRITEFTYQTTPFVVSTVDSQNIVVGSIGQPNANGNSLLTWWQSTANWDALFG